MTPDLFRVVYTSRNLVPADMAPAEFAGILAKSRANNANLDVTGALLFCDDGFAQALEGPLDAVCTLFEVIQCDPRHDEVVVLEAATVTARIFAGWSMACAGREAGRGARVAELTGADGGTRVLDLLHATLSHAEAA